MASEVQRAQLASETEDTIFGKIVRGDIPTQFIYEDDKCVAFHDINPPGPCAFFGDPKEADSAAFQGNRG
ncbi:hypothetical protein MRX96_026426 [Rhipicephalus microplus]